MNKRQNSINLSEISPKRNGDGKLICLNCDKLLPKRRQKYCSDECSYDWGAKHNQNLMRSKFIKRTKGFCNHCKKQPLKQESIPYHINTVVAYEEYKTLFDIVTSSPHFKMWKFQAEKIMLSYFPLIVPASTTELATEEICCRGSISTGVKIPVSPTVSLK